MYDGRGMCSRQRSNASGWFVLWLVTLPVGLGCGRGPFRLGNRDAGGPDRVADVPLPTDQPTGSRDVGLPEVPPDLGAETRDLAVPAWDVATETRDLAAEAGPPEVATIDVGHGADACIPIGCHDPICIFDYCGKIGDGCGGTLDCGNQCPVGQVCAAADGMCRGDATCVALTCDNGTPGRYCGDIGDGCGGALHCGTDCGRVGWVCENHICVGGPDCGPGSCDGPSGEQYCGTIGDGCGGRLACSSSCSGSGRTCRDNLCVETVGCPKVGCGLADGGRYCGVIGDGCGGAQDCGATCPDGSACGSVRANECGAGTSSPPASPKLPLPAPPVPMLDPVPPPPPLCLPPPPAPQP